MKLVVCTIQTSIPSGLCLEGEGTEHVAMGHVTLENRGGKFFVDGYEVVRYRSNYQYTGMVIGGHKLRKELQDRKVLNACILDALLEHPELIPDDWGDGHTYFWGDIYRDKFGDLCVRYLIRKVGGKWEWSHCPLDYDFGPIASAAELSEDFLLVA